MYKNFLFVVIIIIILGFITHTYNNFDQYNTWLLNQIIVLRGILAPNYIWWTISDILLYNNSSGINTYNSLKKKYDGFAPSYMFGRRVFVVTGNTYIKTILDNSPDLFSVGDLKMLFFKSFMKKNVGVSTGCPWKNRRYMNEIALQTDRLHIYAEKYNNDISKQLIKWENKKKLSYKDFSTFGRLMVAKIVFNTEKIDKNFFQVFSQANTTEVFYNSDFKINKDVYNNYLKVINHYINKPEQNSLIELCLSFSNNAEEIRHQIPHFIFPIAGLFITTIPRLLLLLCNHREIFKNVIDEIYSINGYNINNSEEIYKLKYLRKCILETLRLNNPVITTFRTLTKNYRFDSKYSFKKGTQFLILNNPVLREQEFFKSPNKFIPTRWNSEIENSYYALSFNQGPQRCPGKELAIYLTQSFIYNFIKMKKIGINNSIHTGIINTDFIKQMINPFKINFTFSK